MRISDWSSDVCSSDLVERCRVLLHLVDGTAEDVAGAYRTVRRELEAYGGGLPEKAEVVGLNKCDALSEESVAEKTAILKEMTASPILALSGATGKGVEAVLRALLAQIRAARAAAERKDAPEAGVAT